MKIWSYTVVIAVLTAVFVFINSGYCQDGNSEIQDIHSSVSEVTKMTTKNLQTSDRYKEILFQTLTEEGWESFYIDKTKKYLMDPRAEFKPVVLNRNSTHQETKEQYDQYLTKQSVDVCMDFWKSHGEEVTNAISSYNVPPEIILAILKVESNFGSHKGRQAVFNVFWSLSISDNPEIMNDAIVSEGQDAVQQRKRLHRRARWGRSELNELVNLVIDLNNENLLWEESSWAGAFGLPQFIPSSFRAYARDGNNDGLIDLNNISDASISIANYFKCNGWKVDSNTARKKKVIMRYNNSIHYAECILELAESIMKRIEEE
ncbi:lytic murein transglycosylase [bacterium]|nr:lytic murein transglycosylase [bacterium]